MLNFPTVLIPLVGHHSLRSRLSDVIARGSLPATLLLHGPPGGGKERLALWIGERLLCAQATAAGEPCGECQHCQYVRRGVHPDLPWVFPVAKPKSWTDSKKVGDDDVKEVYASAIEDRLDGKPPGVWSPVSQSESLFIGVIKSIVRRAILRPAFAARKVIVVGDAHRLISQEGREESSNAFLKLLEEPPPNTTIVLATSNPASLLATIQSRVSRIHVPELPGADRAALDAMGVPTHSDAQANKAAAALLDAARDGAAARYRVAMGIGAAGARGDFSDTLGALSALLHARARDAAERGDTTSADGAARAVAIVEKTKRLAHRNLNPQLLAATLLDEIQPLVAE